MAEIDGYGEGRKPFEVRNPNLVLGTICAIGLVAYALDGNETEGNETVDSSECLAARSEMQNAVTGALLEAGLKDGCQYHEETYCFYILNGRVNARIDETPSIRMTYGFGIDCNADSPLPTVDISTLEPTNSAGVLYDEAHYFVKSKTKTTFSDMDELNGYLHKTF